MFCGTASRANARTGSEATGRWQWFCRRLRLKSLQFEDEAEGVSSIDWACMGAITPLNDLDHLAVEPLRIYKFRPRFFLTMGAWIHTLRPLRFDRCGDRR